MNLETSSAVLSPKQLKRQRQNFQTSPKLDLLHCRVQLCYCDLPKMIFHIVTELILEPFQAHFKICIMNVYSILCIHVIKAKLISDPRTDDVSGMKSFGQLSAAAAAGSILSQ